MNMRATYPSMSYINTAKKLYA